MKNKGGRPPKTIEFKQFEQLCSIQCTAKEICAVLGLTDKTLYRLVKKQYKESFSAVFKKLAETGKSSLRRAQYKSAIINGNVTMQIWLGKQYLAQTDRQEFTGDINVTLGLPDDVNKDAF